MFGIRCWLLGHRWEVREPSPWLPFDRGGVLCARCYKHHGINTPEAERIARQHNL